MYNAEITQNMPEDLNTVRVIMKVIEAFTGPQSQEWLGYSPYQRTKKFLTDGDVESLLTAKAKDGIM